MSCAIDLQRQEDEVAVISSIYDETEFFHVKLKEGTRCSVTIHPIFLKKLEIKFSSGPSDMVLNDSISVEHLPPIRMYIYLPNTYPSKTSPEFCLSIIWLSPWEISLLCQKLDEIWEENQGNEIIFLWINFLQNDLFSFLNISESLDISFLHLIHTSRDNITLRLIQLSDPRAQNGALLLDIKRLLISYDKKQHKAQFVKNFYTCYICFEECAGLNCIELENCGHVYCKSCMEKHVRIRIVEYINEILCPTIDCKRQISDNNVKTLCPDLFFQYEEIMLRVTLDTMDDVVYCPQISCQYPVIRNPDDTAPICPICKFCFCIYCRKMYHGQAPCEMTSTDTIKLIDEYRNSSNKKKQMLEKTYGKRQMQLIEKYLTTEYLQDNAKSCPKCRSFISKTEGCNKMTCRHCQSLFCWLCNEQIYGYEHFNNVDSQCYGLLFHGIDTDNVLDYVIGDAMDNINPFFEDLHI
ncbi:E3 ubiquitin-protein ligase RNF14 [Atta colombica]|uniref:RBR-type E3 ubiquitin transferase n=1 Tax=Atta colombica TaxID=520822 RepID=A0A195BQG7_9HYME|nr:PREDICTED: E3 ubiquitin-protein ligase RNF14-like [Atta colombica]KYM88211.1 E3 ubiquitin-protein ligase RNF14 [Atta colombica]